MTEGWCGCHLGADSGDVLISSWVGRRFWKGSSQQEEDPRQLEKGALVNTAQGEVAGTLALHPCAVTRPCARAGLALCAGEQSGGHS